jgi:hypothetical protein
VRGRTTSRDQTVNRAFSRRFFLALEHGTGVVTPEIEAEHDVSGPAMMLDEADLLEAADLEDEAEMLDESDLIPT